MKNSKVDSDSMAGFLHQAYNRWLGSKSRRDENVLSAFTLTAKVVLGWTDQQIQEAQFGNIAKLDNVQTQLFNLIISNK